MMYSVYKQVRPRQPRVRARLPQTDIRLIKPGNELHAPDDTMRITRSKVVFIENLKTDGKVTQAITDYLKDKSVK